MKATLEEKGTDESRKEDSNMCSKHGCKLEKDAFKRLVCPQCQVRCDSYEEYLRDLPV